MLIRSIAVVLLVGACTKETPPPPPAHAPISATATPTAPVTPASPHAGMAPAPAATGGPFSESDISGTVVETMNAASYTYAKLERDGVQAWVAGPETQLAVGAKIGKTSGSLMTGFKSETLKRTFDQIYFVGALPVVGGGAATATAPVPGKTAAAAPVDKIAPVKGGTTVEKIWADKASLGGKPVVVKGKVVKVNNGIMGKNWLHIQDGTGAAGTNDLTITSATGTAALGDVVVVRGNISLNKDFGAGYSYAVMIEDATVGAN